MSREWALEVMRKAPYITVSFTRPDGTAYGVPLSLACTDEETWYFHSAMEGDKLEAIAAHPEVCLSAVTRCTPTVGPLDHSFTLQFKSAIAFGVAEQVTDEAEKCRALSLIMRQQTGREFAFAREQAQSVAVLKIEASSFTGKRRG